MDRATLKRVERVRRSWRWFVVLALLVGLGAIPAVVGALPARARDVAPADLAAAVLGSTHPYSGYAEASGRLGLPELGDLDASAGLLSNLTKIRIWWLDPTAWRVDQLSDTGETDVYGDATGTWTWDSEARRVRRVDVTAPVRLPTAADVLPPALARRLLDAAEPGELQPLAAVRVAGRSVPGVRIVPASPASTIGHADIWADPDTGVTLRVSVVPRTTGTAGFETQFLDLSQDSPSRARVTFHRPTNVRNGRPQTDIVRQVASASPITLPNEIAGLARGPSQSGAVGTYGTGFDVVGVLAVPSFAITQAIPSTIALTDRPWGGQARIVSTTLVNAMAFDVGGTGYVVAGPVTVDELDRIAGSLAGAKAPS